MKAPCGMHRRRGGHSTPALVLKPRNLRDIKDLRYRYTGLETPGDPCCVNCQIRLTLIEISKSRFARDPHKFSSVRGKLHVPRYFTASSVDLQVTHMPERSMHPRRIIVNPFVKTDKQTKHRLAQNICRHHESRQLARCASVRRSPIVVADDWSRHCRGT